MLLAVLVGDNHALRGDAANFYRGVDGDAETVEVLHFVRAAAHTHFRSKAIPFADDMDMPPALGKKLGEFDGGEVAADDGDTLAKWQPPFAGAIEKLRGKQASGHGAQQGKQRNGGFE